MAQPIGMLGGTFDPVHVGHLRLALECREALKLAEIRLVPVASPPHRGTPVAAASDRLEMLKLAVEHVPGLVVDDREIRRGGTSYTVDTLASIRGEIGAAPLCLVMGMDAFQQLHTWSRWTALLDHAHIIVVDRPGSELQLRQPEVADMYSRCAVDDAARLAASPAGSIYRAGLPLLDISASRVRALIAASRDPRFLLAEGTWQYLQTRQLYKGG